ncbi:hypothetical protein HD553DRAFT_325162 [Filobasidium floriforme]|uniref:uncharacterized protein n=1 Tax=Filobasidium floriforme TaxID=5210 RepID=UPI001E8DEB78|nr:uncharacterized protein HD553DRAFT_325162 [Filobasidium floriforme]KAH8082336.1 hypothetical protein HD553DRAFT_325162 [Filobasidium floriforme]
MVLGDYQFPHVHFDVSMWGPYLPTLGRLDHSKPHTSRFGDGRLAPEASLLVWDARRSNLSGTVWFINRGKNKSTGDPWTVIQREIKKDRGQPIPSYEQMLIATELLERVILRMDLQTLSVCRRLPSAMSHRGRWGRSYALFLEDGLDCIAVKDICGLRDITVASKTYEENGQVEKEIPFVLAASRRSWKMRLILFIQVTTVCKTRRIVRRHEHWNRNAVLGRHTSETMYYLSTSSLGAVSSKKILLERINNDDGDRVAGMLKWTPMNEQSFKYCNFL